MTEDETVPAYADELPPTLDSRGWITEENLADHLSDQWWRLNNLYQIVNKEGKAVRFTPNYEQTVLWHNLWYRNVLLKARQFGGTTLLDVWQTDTCLFNPNHAAGIIAHTREDASKIFATKVQFPYQSLHPALRELVKAETDSKSELAFSNGSNIRVGTSMRSGTVQQLHVSELGKIAATRPDKAREIMTGAVEAVPKTGTVTIESTAEGRGGYFYDLCETARKIAESAKELDYLDYRFHFFAWWHNTGYTADPDKTVMTKDDIDYFLSLSARGIELTDAQQAWYVQKKATMQDDIKREYPSYPEEAFEASHEGLIFGKQMTLLRRKGRIGDVPHDPMFPVYTAWDIGLNDDMAIWFIQQVGASIRLIDYEAGPDEGWSYWGSVLAGKPYHYMGHYMPHDANQRVQGLQVENRTDIARRVGIRPIFQAPRPLNPEQLWTQITVTRAFLGRCVIDASNCAKGIVALDNYAKVWDERLGTFRNVPRHDEHSHGASALRSAAVIWREFSGGEGAGGYEPEAEATY